ncbi:MAG: error-prone DNA polymerase [Acidiferrobacterales bacterium]
MDRGSSEHQISTSRGPSETVAAKKGRRPVEFAELHAVSNFTFLRGASHPEELVTCANDLGYSALALTDECSVAGVVRAHVAAKNCNFKLIIGSEFRLQDGLRLILYATNRKTYGDLAQLITRGRRAAEKGRYHLTRSDISELAANCLALWLPGKGFDVEYAQWLAGVFPDKAWIAVEMLQQGNDRIRLQRLTDIGIQTGLPLVAANDIHAHARHRRPLQDTLTAIRLRTTIETVGHTLHANGERHLRRREILARLYPHALIAETLVIAERCQFSLDELRYEYPEELVPGDETAGHYLKRLTEAGIKERWPEGETKKVRQMIEHELQLIAELNYEHYFLTVYDIVKFARSQNILCQGRGSAANSAVCYVLGITEVDPSRMEMLFERFISKERNEPPDIDVDFEHERREEVIQYLYRKYGRHRTALTATVVTYRPRSAIRDVGKALGLSLEQVNRLVRNTQWWEGYESERLREIGFDPANPVVRRLMLIVHQILGFPRHLSQHVGGFVIARDDLSRLVPIENAAMPERTIIQWDKDDLDALGLLKVDCLALGMLTAIHRACDLLSGFRGRPYSLASIPPEDPTVYEMIQHGDTVGVFQIESRAQMSMLPRLKPANFYDLVIEVAIVRPGPIQGNMVHPYLRRRQGLEPVTYPSVAVEDVLKRTLGVPIFQEQVIKLAMVAAGFSPGEADQLRRSMAAWKRHGGLEHFEQRLIDGMAERGYPEEFARRIFQQILGFGEYGFPESHAASFALLAYASAWFKCHEPAAFTCALLNSLPMGFYGPSQLVQDAKRHGVVVRPPDVMESDRDCSLEADKNNEPVLRLGLCMIKGLSQVAADRVVTSRQQRGFVDVSDLVHRAVLNRREVEALSAADALRSLAGHRHRARWQALAVETPTPLLGESKINEAQPLLRSPTEGEDIVEDYRSLALTLRRHPLSVLRERLATLRLTRAEELTGIAHGCTIRTAGLVISRQRPGTATGVVFVTLEDETGLINLVVWNRIMMQYRSELLGARLLVVDGEVQREGEVIHVIVKHLQDYSELLGELRTVSRDFH